MDPGDVERQLLETAESKKKLKENYRMKTNTYVNEKIPKKEEELMYYLSALLIDLLSSTYYTLLAENY
jgi:hypothetical protein